MVDDRERWCDHAAADTSRRIGGIYCPTCGGFTWLGDEREGCDHGRPTLEGGGVIRCETCGARASLDEDDHRLLPAPGLTFPINQSVVSVQDRLAARRAEIEANPGVRAFAESVGRDIDRRVNLWRSRMILDISIQDAAAIVGVSAETYRTFEGETVSVADARAAHASFRAWAAARS